MHGRYLFFYVQEDGFFYPPAVTFFFRSSFQEQMQQVLDAMFERRVQAGDFVIKQGDDGDNFYVIES